MLTPEQVAATRRQIETRARGRTAIPLVEAYGGPSRGLRLNRSENVIVGTTLITANSTNGVNKKRKYSDAALRQIASMAEGIPAYANHVSPDLAFKPRDVRDLIGRHVNVRYDANTGKVVSDLHLLEHQAPWVFALAERLGDSVGLSLVSKGVVRMEGDTEVVDQVIALRSGDLVSDPASTKGLFEAALQEAREHHADPHARARVLLLGEPLETGLHEKLVQALHLRPASAPRAEEPAEDLHARLAQAVRR